MRKSILEMVSLCLMVCALSLPVGCRFIAGVRSIHKAANKGDLEKVKRIIERDPTQISVQDNLGKTPLYYASSEGHTEIVEYLLAHGAAIELGNNLAERPLAKAAKFRHYNTVKVLLEHGATVNCKDKYGNIPLHEAALWGGEKLINLLISYGADVNARDEHQNTPLHQAAMLNNIEAAKALVEHGAAIFAKNYYDYTRPAEKWKVPPPKSMNKTPKEIALRAGFKELAQYLQTKEDEKKKEEKEDKLEGGGDDRDVPEGPAPASS
ncbi:MAG: ankyrin repeat domain-containing protein [Planctomycetota bacterium]